MKGAAKSMTLLMAGLALALAAGCHEVTEYTESGEFGAVILNSADLSVEGYVAGIDGGKSLHSHVASTFLVGTGSGKIYWVDSGSQQVIDVRQVTAGAGAEIRSMVSSPSASSLYLLTGQGKILEMDLQDFGVLDEFTAGISPSDICRHPASLARIYVCDPGQGTVMEYYTSGNQEGAVIEVPSAPVALAPYTVSPARLVCAHSDNVGLSVIDLDMMYAQPLLQEGTYSDVAVAMEDSVICATVPNWEGSSGYVHLIFPSGIQPSVYSFAVQGHPVCVSLCSAPGLPYFFVACAEGDRTNVVGINFLYRRLDMQVQLDGYPWAIAPHDSGERLLVLTSL